MTFIRGLRCWLPKKWGGGHRWGKAFHNQHSVRDDETWWKQCRRCDAIAPVKRRKVAK